jgi:hypothetical protein
MKRPLIELMTAILAALGVATLATASLAGILSHQLLGAVLVLGALWAVLSRAWMLYRKTVAWPFLKAPLAPQHRTHLRQALGRAFFWLMVTLTILVIFPRVGLWQLLVAVVVAGVIRVGAELLVPVRVGRGVTAVLAVSGLLLGVELVRTLLPGDPAQIVMLPPVQGEWLVLQGGRTSLVSHHVAAYNQQYALDLMRLEDGTIIRDDDPPTNASWFSWESPLVAPVDGKVVVALDGTEDTEGLNLVADKEAAAGNTVVIQEASGRFVLLAHLRNGSVRVKVGDVVTAGQQIGLAGNSGNTTSPHLHLQVQTHADLWDPDNRSVPFTFTGREGALQRNDLVTGKQP